ncbi:MAG: hypothetical protein H7338_14350 [Candidatus Sericytochromatia bacterium]|nr:hypothetical protein [Candidatus Sericytochromatia bacterium]
MAEFEEPTDAVDPDDQSGESWLSPDKPAELLWGAVLTASEIELRELHDRLWPHLAFDEAGFKRNPASFRWLLAKRAVSRAHGEDSSAGLAMLAEGLTTVWQAHPELQVEMLIAILQDKPTDDILRRFSIAAGIPLEFLQETLSVPENADLPPAT